ncbi:FAD-dependent pyridine nucleotide-disulfide oxidoreductase [Pseudohyphozyma bogoriensis]|nr:FAD-dependent pyridine nucleotide-disulfide oxidoreductase [Pseudohyphozyma bogoriensis]
MSITNSTPPPFRISVAPTTSNSSSSPSLGTVRFHGRVGATSGEWYGVEWDDPARGKHSGVHHESGQKYFDVRLRDSATFIRPTLKTLSIGTSFPSALRDKYSRSTSSGQTTAHPHSHSKLKLEMTDLSLIEKNLEDWTKLREVGLEWASVNGEGTELELEEVKLPNVHTLNLSYNLLPSLASVSTIASRLPALRTLILNGNRFVLLALADAAAAAPPPPFLPGFRSLTTLHLNSTLVEWPTDGEKKDGERLFAGMDMRDARLLVIARISSLRVLEGTAITKQEREDAERFYLHEAEKVAEGSREDKFPRWRTLAEKYGRLPPRTVATDKTVGGKEDVAGVSSQMSPAELKNVVVIGLGLGGTNAIEAIEKTLPASHRIVVITENEFAYFPLASIRAATVPGWEEKILGDPKTLFAKSSRHVVLARTKVVELRLRSVIVDTVHSFIGFTEELCFDYLVYATGSIYNFPFRPCEHTKSRDEILKLLRSFQSQLKAANSILVVGGGASGVEFAGEIAAEYKGSKKVTLAHTAKLPLITGGWKADVTKKVKKQLLELGVVVEANALVDTKGLHTGPVENQRFDLGNGRSAQADFLILAHGLKPRNELIKAFHSEVLDVEGFVNVKPTLQVATKDGSLNHWFAVGDINNADPTKQAVWADLHGPVVAANITSLIARRPASKTYTSGTRLGVFALGPKGGAAQIYFGVTGGKWLATMIKSKKLFTDEFEHNWGKQ